MYGAATVALLSITDFHGIGTSDAHGQCSSPMQIPQSTLRVHRTVINTIQLFYTVHAVADPPCPHIVSGVVTGLRNPAALTGLAEGLQEGSKKYPAHFTDFSSYFRDIAIL